MAGGGKSAIRIDPELTRYNNLYVNRHKYFRWTPRTAGITFAFVVAVPALFGYIGYTTDGKYDMRAKLRGDTIVEW